MIKKTIIIFSFLLFQIIHTQAQATYNIMSYNIRLDVASDGVNRWDVRKERLATLIKYYEPDLFGLQEVLNHQYEYLNESLNQYRSFGAGRDDGKNKGERSCIYYKKDKFTLLQQHTFWLSSTPYKVSKGWDAALERVCTYGLFQDKKTKKKFWMFNTHFDHIGKEARLESAKLIVQKINEVNTKNFPVFVTGDFNSKDDEPPAQYMSSKLTDCFTNATLAHGNGDTWNAFKFLEIPKGRIDYVFTNLKSGIKKFATITDSYELKYISDHFPIMATIEIKK